MSECSTVQRRSDPSLPSRWDIMRNIWSWKSWSVISVFIGWGGGDDEDDGDKDDVGDGEEEEDCRGLEGDISSVI